MRTYTATPQLRGGAWLMGFSSVTEGKSLDEISKKINECLIEGGTLGEKFMSVALELTRIKDNEKQVYELIENEIDEILIYAKSINYL